MPASNQQSNNSVTDFLDDWIVNLHTFFSALQRKPVAGLVEFDIKL